MAIRASGSWVGTLRVVFDGGLVEAPVVLGGRLVRGRVFRIASAGAKRRRAGGEAEASEDLARDDGIFDRGEQAHLRAAVQTPKRVEIRWGCVVRGALLDLVLTMVGSVPLLLPLAGPEAFSEDETAQAAVDQALASPEGLLWGAVMGLMATVIAAWYGARRAGVHPLRHGGWVAVVSATLAVPFLLVPGTTSSIPTPVWYEAASLAAMLPAGLVGGALAGWRQKPADREPRRGGPR